MPQLRKNPVTREWVIVAQERSRRPGDFNVPVEDTSGRPVHDSRCPFCAGNEGQTPSETLALRATGEPDTTGWTVRVVPNKFPALNMEGDLARHGQGMYDSMNAVGAHEVVIETPDHNQSLATIPQSQCRDVLWACRDRFVELSRDRRFKYILFFRNQGRVAGASVEHAHSQLIALPVVPIEVLAEIEGMSLYAEYRDRCPYCDMVNQERETVSRVVFETTNYLVFEPFASKFAFETWIVPKRHQSSFSELEAGDMDELAGTLQDSLRRIDKCLNFPPYSMALHTVPINTSRPEDFHWHIQISPRLTISAGLEMGTGIYINSTSPEEAARFMREAG